MLARRLPDQETHRGWREYRRGGDEAPRRDSDGAWWTGYQFAEQVLWPKEKPTWTAGAVLLAVDALTHHTAASGLFLSPALED